MSRERDRKIRSTPEGRAARNKSSRDNSRRVRATPEGREASRKECRRRKRKRYAESQEFRAEVKVRCDLRKIKCLRAIPVRAFKGERAVTRQANYDRLHTRLDSGSKKSADLLCPDFRERLIQLELEKKNLMDFLGVDMHLDHKQSLHMSGEHHPDNIWPIPATLNLSKQSKSLGVDWEIPTNTFESVTYRTHMNTQPNETPYEHEHEPT